MELISDVGLEIVAFLAVLTALVYVHEWGHYWVARRNGVRVEVFSIGFGPEVYGWTNAVGTRWKISAIPLGGYVKMFGEGDTVVDEDGERELTDEEKSVSFAHKTLRQRAAIVVAGPMANFIFAALVFAALACFVGSPTPLSGVGTVSPDSPAQAAGFVPKDSIVAINGEDVRYFSDLQRIVGANPGQTLEIDVIRADGTAAVLSAVPSLIVTEDGREIGRLGISPDPEQVEYEREDPISALWFGVERTGAMIWGILNYIGDLFSGAQDTDGLGGPLRIAQLSGEMAADGLVPLIIFAAALSVNLGLINLFPVPMLDGGHLVFYAFEAVLGRPLDERAQEYGFRFGLVLVLVLFVFVTWNDLEHRGFFEFFKNLAG
ncbi:MAG: RIP metalloprotease RseP [Rhodospirillales bacterium]